MFTNRILVLCDLSNFEYFTIFGAFSKWLKKDKSANLLVKSPEETDQDNLPDILTSQTFRKELSDSVHKRFDVIDWFLRKYHQPEIDSADGIDFIFTCDADNGFRRSKYAEYKAQRHLIKKQFNVSLVKHYIETVLFKEIDISNYGYKTIYVDGAESDDIIAILSRHYKDDYLLRIIISSDNDFLQLEDVIQYNMYGDKIEPKVKNCPDILTNKEFLLYKIIRGDVSDNIPSIAAGVGEKKALMFAKNPDKLKDFMKKHPESVKQFALNKFLIDFNSMPDKLKSDIIEESKKILENKNENKDDLSSILMEL
jgi:5'-3' exonuclease